MKLGHKHIKVDGDKLDIALEYTPGDRLVIAEIDGSELAVKVAEDARRLADDDARAHP